MVENDLIEQVSNDFEEFIHERFFFRKMLLVIDPMVVINMFDREVLVDYVNLNKEDETFVKNTLFKKYNTFMENWTNYEINDSKIEEEVRRAIEIYSLKEAQSSYYECIEIGINYLKDHGVTNVEYKDYEFLKYNYDPVVSDYDKYDADKRCINHILLSILNRSLNSYDDYISVNELIIENNQNLAKDKAVLANEYIRQGLEVPFTVNKKTTKGPVRTKK